MYSRVSLQLLTVNWIELTSFNALLRPTAVSELPSHDQLAATTNRFRVWVLGRDERENSPGGVDDLTLLVVNVLLRLA